MNTLFILNDPPYGTERSYNALRLAGAVARTGAAPLRVFLMGDAAACARGGQKTPDGWYNLNRMVDALTKRDVPVGVCGTCMDARGIEDPDLVGGAKRSTLDELAAWTAWADKVIVF